MKTHLIFCCCRACAKKEMGDLINSTAKYQYKVKHPDTVLIGYVRYIFIVDINCSPERIRGLLPESFRTCSNYVLSHEVLCYLKSHLDKRS